jgi:hypothetical protein
VARTVWHNKKDTIARVEREFRALDRAVRRLGTKGLDEPVPGFGARARIKRERWLRKDALAHIVEWKSHQLRTLRGAPPDRTLRGLPIARQNRLIYERWHGRPAREIVAIHRRVGREVRDAMRALPDAYYRKRFSPAWPNELLGGSRWHREHHLETPSTDSGSSIRSARRGSTSGRARAR